MRFLSCFTVKSFPGVTVREHKILGSGSDRYTHTMSRKKGIGQFGRPDRYLIDFARFQIFRMFKPIAVFCPDHSIGQNIRPFFFLCVIFWYFQLIFGHIDDMHGRIFRIIIVFIHSVFLWNRYRQHTVSTGITCSAGTFFLRIFRCCICRLTMRAVQIKHFSGNSFNRPAHL